MSKVKLAIQLYTVRDYIQNYTDADKAFRFIKDFGCDAVQISAIGPIEPEKVKELVEKYGFDVCVTHKPFVRMQEELDELIDEHLMINCDTIGLGAMDEKYRSSKESVMEFISIANKIAAHMGKRGCRFAYHNHDFEFKKIDGDKTIMDLLISETDPELFTFVPDVAWAQIAGVEPCDFLRRLKGRVKVAHFKDYTFEGERRRFIELGKGKVDFDAIYKTCLETEIPYVAFEQDIDWTVNALESCRESFEFMQRLQSQYE